MHWIYYVVRWLTRAALSLLTSWRVIGRENIPPEGPLLIVTNHLSLADPPVIGASIRRKMAFMAKQELFRSPFTAYLMRGYGAFPVNREKVDRNAFRQAEECLAKGMALVMFPEGKRSFSRQLQAGLPGAALVASRSGAAILPVGISGTEVIRGKTWWLRRPRITVNIGRAFTFPAKSHLSREGLDGLTGYMMNRIAAQLPEEYRGEYKVDI